MAVKGHMPGSDPRGIGKRAKIRDTWANTSPGRPWQPYVRGYEQDYLDERAISPRQMQSIKGTKY